MHWTKEELVAYTVIYAANSNFIEDNKERNMIIEHVDMQTFQKIHDEFAENSLDCLVYGHSHQPACHHHDGILFFNPGSATDRRSMDYHSVGLLEVDDDIRGTIIRLD